MNLEDLIYECTCPACGYHVAVPFYKNDDQPMATVAWPLSAPIAVDMPRYPLDFMRCIDCGHIYNRSFDYRNVPYSEKPNLMYNKGLIWTGFLSEIIDKLSENLKPGDTVIEIGYGDGSFIHALAERNSEVRFTGFDPHGMDAKGVDNLTLRSELFIPGRDIPELLPQLLISRHVLEHVTNPLGLVESISFASSITGICPRIYLEVPCVDNALVNNRIIDFYYEHNSHFTTRSFTRMLECAKVEPEIIGHGYGGEIIYTLAQVPTIKEHRSFSSEATGFFARSNENIARVREQLDMLAGKNVAIWGGTGKAAAFINSYKLDAGRFPIVVDSDKAKAGTFVPGTGQEIRYRDYLLEHPAEIIIIPMHWRAQDVVNEISRNNISYSEILIEHDGQLVDFFNNKHPYRISGN